MNQLNLIPEPKKICVMEGKSPCGSIHLYWKGEVCGNIKAVASVIAEDISLSEFNIEIKNKNADIKIELELNASCAEESYSLKTSSGTCLLKAGGRTGIFYGMQTFCQLLHTSENGYILPHVEIEDSPDLIHRAAHYDMKHHQCTFEFAKEFIRTLTHYKLNILVWEWEDKLAYESYPEIAAPGAFTKDQMKELTRYAMDRGMQIVPLVQGFGHVSFILKHPRFRHLREIPDSNYQFCPLKDETYEVLFNLWREAVEATPDVEFLHIGSDEVYDLGVGGHCGCSDMVKKEGHNTLMQLFIERCVDYVENTLGRKVISWGGEYNPCSKKQSLKTMIFADSSDSEYLLEAKQNGYSYWVYAPNPGIVPLALPLYDYTRHSFNSDGEELQNAKGVIFRTANTISEAALNGSVTGSITTSWDDSGHHILMWMPNYICAADFSWHARLSESIDEWIEMFFSNYFGSAACNLAEMYTNFYRGANFYHYLLQRAVWHWYSLGKMDIPNVPHNVDLEFNNFWRIRHKQAIFMANELIPQIDRVFAILKQNIEADIKHSYDLKLVQSCAELIRHDLELVKLLEWVEKELDFTCSADSLHFKDNTKALANLKKIVSKVNTHIAKRYERFKNLVELWELTRLPKGYETPKHSFIFARDKVRHFANRTPGMEFLIIDEKHLKLEEFVEEMEQLIEEYKIHIQIL